MHVVVWTVSGERYAVETRFIVEIVPVVEPRRLPRSPAWLIGLMNYRGALIPVLDLRSLVHQGASEVRRSSRILVVHLAGETDNGELVGLLAESLEAVERHEFDGASARPGLGIPEAPFLGAMALTDRGTIQLVLLEELLQDEQRAVLFDRVSRAEA